MITKDEWVAIQKFADLYEEHLYDCNSYSEGQLCCINNIKLMSKIKDILELCRADRIAAMQSVAPWESWG